MSKPTLETILRDHFDCKKPVLKRPVVFTDLDGYDSKRYLTVSGFKAYAKLIGLLYDLKNLVEDDIDFDVDGIIEDLDTIAMDWDYGLSEERLK